MVFPFLALFCSFERIFMLIYVFDKYHLFWERAIQSMDCPISDISSIIVFPLRFCDQKENNKKIECALLTVSKSLPPCLEWVSGY